MAQTTANADAVLQNDYIGPVREALNQKAVLMFHADTDDEEGSSVSSTTDDVSFRGLARESEQLEFAGRQYIIPVHSSRNEGGGAIDEGGPVPVAGQQGWTDVSDNLRHVLWSIELTRFAIRLSARNEGAFLKLLEAETKGATKDMRKDVNRMAYGNQTGTLAAVTADGANTVTVDTVQYLRINQRIDLVDSTNDTILNAGGSRTITAINDTTKVVTYSGTDLTATTNHRICRTGSWKKEINGLGKLVDNTGVVHGVDSSLAVNKWHRSQVQDLGGAQFNEDAGQQMIDNIDVTGNNEVDFIVTTHGIVRRYSNQLKGLKQFSGNDVVRLRGGFKALLFNEMPMIKDPDAPKGIMWFLNTDALMWAWLPDGKLPGDWGWVDDDGAILTRKADRTDAFEGYLAGDFNLNAPSRNSLGKMINMEDDAAVSGS